MTEDNFGRLIARFRSEVAAAEDRNAADRAFFCFIREFAAKRAAADHAKLEAEAHERLEVDEPEDLHEHFLQRVADLHADFAREVGETLDHVPPEDRDIYEIAARVFHEAAFDRLMAPADTAGCC